MTILLLLAMRNSQLLAELEAREKNDAERWQKAGMSRVPKTFAHDPRQKGQVSSKPVINVRGIVVNQEKKAERL